MGFVSGSLALGRGAFLPIGGGVLALIHLLYAVAGVYIGDLRRGGTGRAGRELSSLVWLCWAVV